MLGTALAIKMTYFFNEIGPKPPFAPGEHAADLGEAQGVVDAGDDEKTISR